MEDNTNSTISFYKAIKPFTIEDSRYIIRVTLEGNITYKGKIIAVYNQDHPFDLAKEVEINKNLEGFKVWNQ